MIDIITNQNNLNNRNTHVLHKTYNEFQTELLRLDTHNALVGSVNKLREDRIKKNTVNINSLDADLMTTRRQVEIVQNRNLIKEDIIYILRAIFLLTSLTIIVLVYLEGTQYKKPMLYLLGIYALYYLGMKATSFMGRSANRWTLQNWQGVQRKPQQEEPKKEEDICAAENAKYDAEMAKIKGKILDKMISMKQRFKKLDSRKKLIRERGEKIKSSYQKILKTADTIFDKLPKDKQTEIINARTKQVAVEPVVLQNL